MKKVLSFIGLILALNSYSQYYYDYDINFEDSSQLFRVIIDTLKYPENTCKIGKPQKTIFNSAYSPPNAIVTDLINPYPANDTSVFLIKHVAQQGFVYPHTAILSGYYKIDSDTLNDYGLIEFSPDNGETWIDLINDTIYNQYIMWNTQKPVLTGRTHEWTYFYVNIAGLGYVFTINDYDTLLYRFSFISDQQSEEMEGLIYDNLHFEDWWEGISEKSNNQFESICYPVPASTFFNIEFENNHYKDFDLVIINKLGQTVFSKHNITENRICIKINDFTNGIYFYKLINNDTKQYSINKFVIKQ